MRSRAVLAALIVPIGLLLAGCTDGAVMARQYVAYTGDHPLQDARILQASGYKDTSECGCSYLRVIFGIDGADDLSDPAGFSARLAAVLQQACAFDPSESVEEHWLVDRIGRRRLVDVTDVVGGPDALTGTPRAQCRNAAIARRATALVRRIAGAGR